MSSVHASRTRHWPACYNVRDLGGLPAGAGTTRWRAIVRSDYPARLTTAGRQTLIDYGIRTILDLRKPSQVNAEPSIFMGSTDVASPTYINISLEDHGAATDAAIDAAGTNRATVYCLTLDHNQGQVAKLMQAIAEARPGGILIHCSAGKDRTGVIAALLLGLVGVPDQLIAEDYALSQQQLWPFYEQLVQEAGGEEKVGWWLKPITTPAMMLTVLHHLQQRYGGIIPYLHQAGVTVTTLAQVQARLR